MISQITREREQAIEKTLYDFVKSHGDSSLIKFSVLLAYLSIDLDSIDEVGLDVPEEARRAQQRKEIIIKNAAKDIGIEDITAEEWLWANDAGLIHDVIRNNDYN